ncbi:hypothetical protein HWI79_3235 [Cryptosporidium felis]|nr:hypothetical protein HWI79_3235 [Cryptosporidium felis]
MRRSESSSVLQRYNGRRRSSFAGGRTASASMIGVLTPKSLSSMKDSSKREKSAWSRIFSPLNFGFESKDKSSDPDFSDYSLSRRRTRDYSKSCPSFQRKSSLRPSPDTQVRDRRESLNSYNSSKDLVFNVGSVDLNYPHDEILGLDDLSSSIFEPVLGPMSRSNNISRVQAFSGKDTGGSYVQRSKTVGYLRDSNKTNNYGDLRILRFHDGISGKTFKLCNEKFPNTQYGGKKNANTNQKELNSELNFIEIDSNNKLPLFNRDEFTINRNICVSTALSNKKFTQGDVPYCDSILYLDDPKPRKDDTTFYKLHDNSLYKQAYSSGKYE